MNADLHSTELRALIVEDESLIAEELRERLLRLGVFVTATVDSAEEGVAIAMTERPDLVLMDIRLKGKRDVCRQPKRSGAILMFRLFISRPIPTG